MSDTKEYTFEDVKAHSGKKVSTPRAQIVQQAAGRGANCVGSLSRRP